MIFATAEHEVFYLSNILLWAISTFLPEFPIHLLRKLPCSYNFAQVEEELFSMFCIYYSCTKFFEEMHNFRWTRSGYFSLPWSWKTYSAFTHAGLTIRYSTEILYKSIFLLLSSRNVWFMNNNNNNNCMLIYNILCACLVSGRSELLL